MATVYTGPAATIPDWVPGKPAAEELNLLTAPRIMIPAANSIIPLLYGRDRLQGRPFFVSVDEDGGFLYVGYLFCGGPVTEFEAFYMDGVNVLDDDGFLSNTGSLLTVHLGVDTDAADYVLVEGATFAGVGAPAYTDTLPGVAYIAMKVPKSASKGFPRVEAIIKGQKVYDPRLDSTNGGAGDHRFTDSTTWEYSSNPALCAADFCYQRVGWALVWDGVVATANANDELLSSGLKRREIGLTMATPATSQQWLQGFRAYMAAFVAWEGGALRFVPDRADSEAAYGLRLNQNRLSAPWDYVQAPTHASVQLGTGNFTLQASIRPDAVGATAALLSKFAGVGVAGWLFGTTSTNRLWFWCRSSTGITVNVVSSVLLFDLVDPQQAEVGLDRTTGALTFWYAGVMVGTSTVVLSGSLTTTAALVFGGLSVAGPAPP